MSIEFDPRLQGKQNTTDVLAGGTQAPAPEGSEQPQNAPSNQPTVAPAQGDPNAPQSNLATNKPKSSSSGMFTNTAQYIEKNKPASQDMAQSIGDKVQRSADIARKNIQATQQQFGNLREQGSLQNRDTAVQDVTTAAQQAAQRQAVPRQMQPTGNEVQTSESRTSGPATQVVEPTTQTSQEPQGLGDQDRRIQSILDAQYKGPNELRELGQFGKTRAKTQEAQRLTDQLTGGNQQELLRSTLERQGSNYTQGAKRLDQLLFGQGDPQKILEQRQQQIGDVSGDLSQAQSQARIDAINRTRELGNIRSQARGSLQNIAQGRAGEVDDFLTGQEKAGQDLVGYYQDLLGDSEGGANLGTLEAETLGVQSGVGLYNLLSNPEQRERVLADLDATGNLDRGKLIQRDQQAQLSELERLAQLSSDYGVQDSGLDFRSQFQDADAAGTQSALDALNLDKFGNYLTEAEQDFRTQAANDITGYGRGKAKYNKGMFRGRGTIKKSAYETANLKDMLQDQGYDFESDPSQYIGEANTDILSQLSNLKNFTDSENIDISDAESELDMLAGLSGEDSVLYNNDIMKSLGLSGLGKIATAGGLMDTAGSITEDIGSGVADAGSNLRENIFGSDKSLLGQGLTGGVDLAGNIAREFGGAVQDLGSSFFGGGKGDAKRSATAKARQNALRDLQRRMTEKVSSTGFNNRINVADTEETTQRQRNLLDLLGNIDNTNRRV